MGNKVLLTHSYFYRFDQKQWKSKRYYPPLGTLYAASALRGEGGDVVFHDTNLTESPVELAPLLEMHQPGLLVIYDDGFNYLTKMCLTNMREAAFEMIRMGKEKDCTVIVSSSDSTDHYREYLEKGADYIILGEGEETLRELFIALRNNNIDPGEILGIAYKAGDKVIKTELRPVIRDLDSLPFPSWDLADLEKYKNIWLKNHGCFSINLATTRGCPYNCSWCAKPIYGYEYNSRSPENVVEEMQLLVNTYGVSHFWICDDIFGLKKGWMEKFRRLVGESGLSFTYTVQSRADLILKDRMAENLAATGADTVWLGAESGSQKVLDAMNKGQTVEQIVRARELLKDHGIKAAFFIQFGYLGEELEDIRKTIKMIMGSMPDDLGISISYPLPGTPFHEQVKDELKDKANWTDSDELALMYTGTFPPTYYKRLHRYTHKLYRRRQRMRILRSALVKPSMWNRKLLRYAIAVAYYYPAIWADRLKLKQTGGI